MQLKKLAAAITLCLGSAAVTANDYVGEVGVGYIDFEESDATVLFGEVHFGPVSTSGHPLEEAAYLEQSSNINASYTDFDGGDITTIEAEIYINNFYIAPGYVDSSIFDDGEGYVALGYQTDGGLRVSTTVPEEDYELNLDLKYVTALANGNFINFEAGYADGGDFEDTLSIGADYYFDETFSLGAAVIDEVDTDFEVRVNKFFTGNFRAGLSYTSGDDVDIIMVDASFRF